MVSQHHESSLKSWEWLEKPSIYVESEIPCHSRESLYVNEATVGFLLPQSFFKSYLSCFFVKEIHHFWFTSGVFATAEKLAIVYCHPQIEMLFAMMTLDVDGMIAIPRA